MKQSFNGEVKEKLCSKKDDDNNDPIENVSTDIVKEAPLYGTVDVSDKGIMKQSFSADVKEEKSSIEDDDDKDDSRDTSAGDIVDQEFDQSTSANVAAAFNSSNKCENS